MKFKQQKGTESGPFDSFPSLLISLFIIYILFYLNLFILFYFIFVHEKC